MNKLIIAFAFMMSVPAHAVDFEIGTGTSHYKTAHDGLWYQSQFPHTLDMKSVPFSLGISGERNGLRYRAEYLSLGWVYSNAQVTGDDTNYPGTTVKPHGKMLGRGSVSGGLLSVSKPVPIFGIPFYAEAGAYIYVPKWTVSLEPLDNSWHVKFQTDRTPKLGSVLGFGVRYSGVDIAIRYVNLELNYQGEVNPPIYSHAYTLMMKVYF